MTRNIISIIIGIMLSFLLFFIGSYTIVKGGITPLGEFIRIGINEEKNSIETNILFQTMEQSYYFSIYVFLPGICFLTGLTTAFIVRKNFWLIGLLSVCPFVISFFVLVGYLLIESIWLIPLYLGLGSLASSIIGYFKRRKMIS